MRGDAETVKRQPGACEEMILFAALVSFASRWHRARVSFALYIHSLTFLAQRMDGYTQAASCELNAFDCPPLNPVQIRHMPSGQHRIDSFLI